MPNMPTKSLIRTCSIWRALEVVGDTSTLRILEASWLGARRFDDFREQTGLLKALLSDRLKRLVGAGLLERRLYCDKPPRYEYLMTRKARDLYWVALMALRWNKVWGSDEGKARVELVHGICGSVFDAVPVCGHCRNEIDPREIDWTKGPGAGWMNPIYTRRRQLRSAGDAAQSPIFDRAAVLMGDRWANLILRSIFNGFRHYDEIRRDTAIATNILAERLTWLTENGVITQQQYSTNPPRYEYTLTPKGIDYYPTLLMLLQWGDTYYVAPEGPPLLVIHRTCGQEFRPQVACSACNETITAETVDFRVIEQPDPDAASRGRVLAMN